MSDSKKSILTALQFLVGALVTMGGTLFATFAVNSFGTALGLVHLSVGIAGLVGAVAVLESKARAPSFLLVTNAITIAYSSASETAVQVYSLLPSFASLGSLIGTIVGIIASCIIIAILAGRKPQ